MNRRETINGIDRERSEETASTRASGAARRFPFAVVPLIAADAAAIESAQTQLDYTDIKASFL